MKRPDLLSRFLTSPVRFWTGLSLIPGYFMIRALPPKLLLVGLFALLATLAGKKIRFLYFGLMTLSITFFHLLTPAGRILWQAGPFLITSVSLRAGLLKGVTLSGLVFLSLFSVTPALRLPGRLGGLLARMFYHFEVILEGRKRINPRDFIGSLDRILMEIFPPGDLPVPETPLEREEQSSPFGVLYILLLEGAVWGTVLWEILT